MSAPISSATTSTGSATGQGVSRPQVQSRRVSLKLGPLGITYATDQVLWTPAAAAAAAAGAADADAQATDAEYSAAPTASSATATSTATAESQTAAQQEAVGRTFSQEMLAAWRDQVQERQQATGTYGRTGAASRAQATGESAEVAASAETQAASAESSSQSQQQAAAVPASRVRQAISAYLNCARNYAAASPMLTAVA